VIDMVKQSQSIKQLKKIIGNPRLGLGWVMLRLRRAMKMYNLLKIINLQKIFHFFLADILLVKK